MRTSRVLVFWAYLSCRPPSSRPCSTPEPEPAKTTVHDRAAPRRPERQHGRGDEAAGGRPLAAAAERAVRRRFDAQPAPSSGRGQRLPDGRYPFSEGELPGLSAANAGDAWLGIFKSFDGGASWTTSLLPGFPQDLSPEGMASPLKQFSTAADPIVRAGTNGLFYYSGMAFNRDQTRAAVLCSWPASSTTTTSKAATPSSISTRA
jgi:hypothetical protein